MDALSLSSNIVRRGAVYYIRVRVPSDLLDYYAPKKEITYSLKTKDPREAKRKGNLERVKIDQQFAEARRNGQMTAATAQGQTTTAATSTESSLFLSPLELERLSLLYLHHALADDEASRVVPKSPETIERERQQAQEREDLIRELSEKKGIPYTPPATAPVIRPVGLTAEETDAKRAYAERFIHDAPFFISKGETYPSHHLTDAFIEREHLRIAKESPAYYQLALAILRTESKVQEAILKRLSGEWVETPPLVVAIRPLPSNIISNDVNGSFPGFPHDDNPLFSEVWERYLAERKPAPKTAQDFGAAVRRFMEINGDLPVQSIMARHIRMFKDTLLKCPSRVPKELQGLPILKIIKRLESRKTEEPYPKTLSPKTINDKALTAIKAVLSHAVDNGFIETNPAHQIRAVDPAQHDANNAGPSRIPYDMDDIRMILCSPLFHSTEEAPSNGIMKRLTPEERRDYQRLILLGIFTGARLEEIGQLDVDDIREEDGITYIFIHADTATGRRIKNKTSRRKVPVHPFLLNTGFLPGVGSGARQEEDRRGGGGGKLFPTLTSKTDTLTAPFSKWWRRYTISIGVYTPQKTFHSFRHTFKRTMRDAGIDGKLTDALQGHAGTSIADSYGRDAEGMGYSMPVLFRALCEGLEKGGLEKVVRENLPSFTSSSCHGKK